MNKLNLNRTKFNKGMVSDMSLDEFTALYKGRVHSDVDLTELFKMNGGKIPVKKPKKEEGAE